jgi:hypothetical protein
MSNYKQKIIPETDSKEIKGFSKSELQKFVRDYYQSNYQNKAQVINQDLGIQIEFIGDGKKKTSYGAAMYVKKAAAVKILDKLLQYAKYTNWGDRKPNDKPNVLGYFNFKVKFLFDGEITYFALNVQVRNDGKYHYSLDENRLET